MVNLMVYVVVKNLEYGVLEVMLFVCDFCGRICKVYCKNNVLGSLDYRFCNGIIWVILWILKLYGCYYGENVYDMWNLLLGENCLFIKKI